MKNTTITAATTPQLFIDRELGEMLLQLQEIRKRFDAYLDTHDDPKKFTPCEAAFEVEGDLANAMIGEGTDYANLKIVDELNAEEYGVAFRKGSDAAAAVDAAFDELKADGTMQALADKYGLTLAD